MLDEYFGETGKIDWESVLRALKTTRYSHVLSLELENAPRASHGSFPEAVSPKFDTENLKTMEYLGDIAKNPNINIGT